MTDLTPSAGGPPEHGTPPRWGITPFLLFDGVCAEAMAFYQTCLGGELLVTRLGDTPMGDQAPPGQRHKVAYSCLTSDGFEISATDWLHPTRAPRPGNTVALYVRATGASELKVPFDRLLAGGDPDLLDDLRELPFGIYGHGADRYGVHWFFRAPPPEPDPS